MIEPMDLQASLDSMGILQPAFERWCSNPLPSDKQKYVIVLDIIETDKCIEVGRDTDMAMNQHI